MENIPQHKDQQLVHKEGDMLHNKYCLNTVTKEQVKIKT